MKRRSGEAVAAQHRKAGPMKHRSQPRGGAKDDQPELMAELDDLNVLDEMIEEAEKRADEIRLDSNSSGDAYEAEYSRGAADTWDEVADWIRGKR